MTTEEQAKLAKDILVLREQIDLLYSGPYTCFVQSVHNLSLMLAPYIRQQQALAHKLEELEAKLNYELNKQD